MPSNQEDKTTHGKNLKRTGNQVSELPIYDGKNRALYKEIALKKCTQNITFPFIIYKKENLLF